MPEWRGRGKDGENFTAFLTRRGVFQLYFLHLFGRRVGDGHFRQEEVSEELIRKNVTL